MRTWISPHHSSLAEKALLEEVESFPLWTRKEISSEALGAADWHGQLGVPTWRHCSQRQCSMSSQMIGQHGIPIQVANQSAVAEGVVEVGAGRRSLQARVAPVFPTSTCG